MKIKYGLIGYPLSHSFSRKFFTDKFLNEKIDAEYLNFEIEQIDFLPKIIQNNPELKGLNVTIPFKEQVLSFLDRIDSAADAVKAVNTIKIIHHNGATPILEGFNTDLIGFRDSIKPLLKKYHHKALVLGSGGASKAIIQVLTELGIETIVVSRNPQYKGEISYSDLDEGVMESYKVIVNTTPIGTYPKVEGCPPIPFEYINDQHLLYDLVYNPPMTEFLKQGELKGATVKNGLEMLHLQALASWEIWNS
jgi:shikimate dehydrogenase